MFFLSSCFLLSCFVIYGAVSLISWTFLLDGMRKTTKKAAISNTSFSNKELNFTELEIKNQKHNILHKSYYKSIYNFGKRWF